MGTTLSGLIAVVSVEACVLYTVGVWPGRRTLLGATVAAAASSIAVSLVGPFV